MPDSPDWSKYLPLSKRYSLQDLGELAARLKSLDVYDRRGEVIWWEDWSGGVGRWTVSGVGAGFGVTLDASIWYLSPYSAKIKAGSGATKSVVMWTFLAPLHLTKLGIEIAFVTSNDFSHLNLSLYRYDGAMLTKAEVRLSYADSELLYLDENAAYVEFATEVSIPLVSNLFHQFKLVVDEELDEYVRVLFNETEYDLSGIAARTEANTATARTYLAIELVSSVVTNAIIYCGQVLVTSNEP